MIITNTAKEAKKVSYADYTERTNGFNKCTDIFTKNTAALQDFSLGAYQTKIFELKK
jgi:hypothetical protein